MNNRKLVIVPTYNEVENIADLIQVVMELDGDFHLLVIDDGSPDGTAAIVQAKQEEFVFRLHLIQRKGKLGLGTAYIEGFKWALKKGYDYIFEMDADFSHDPNDLIKLYTACAENDFDLAIGSRYITGVNVVNWPIGRVLMSYFASVYVKFITGLPIKDATAGFKCYHRRVLVGIRLDEIRFIGYAFQIEMKFTAWKLGFRLIEVPIIFTDRTKGTSKMSKGIFKEAILGVISMKIKSIFSPYKLNRSESTLSDQPSKLQAQELESPARSKE
ncbi:polyprenol monophosphomannose synthase [Algoriphagus namhaensis]|uniref:Polyprenol monophosphomannose synthase n=1 Tax=Algoriphagus namhaensis TaxID=915353 RepID=A0ABV8AVA4_9BACT